MRERFTRSTAQQGECQRNPSQQLDTVGRPRVAEVPLFGRTVVATRLVASKRSVGSLSVGMRSVGILAACAGLFMAACSSSTDSDAADNPDGVASDPSLGTAAPGETSALPPGPAGSGTETPGVGPGTDPPGTGTGASPPGSGTAPGTAGTGTGPGTMGTGTATTVDGPPMTSVAQPPTVAPGTVTTEDGAVDCSRLLRPATPLRRLTRYEYNNSVRDLLQTELTPADGFPPDEVSSGFSNNAQVLTVSALHAESYLEASEALATEAVSARLAVLAPCETPADEAAEAACARSFIETFGRRAYRRTLTSTEIDPLLVAYAAGRTDGSYAEGIEVVIRAILQSPDFLYRLEFSGTDAPGVGMVRLNGPETATRLSYLLWASTPDNALLDAAESGGLDTPEAVAEQARTMLADERAKPAIAEFFSQWFGLSHLEISTKNVDLFPLWSDEMKTAMLSEADAVFEHVLWGPDARLETLFTEPVGLPTGPLASLYGVPASNEVATLPDAERSGVLTMPAFLAAQAHPDQTSPVLRGKFVRAQLLCDPPKPPPDDKMTVAPKPAAGTTARERFSAHSASPDCAGCHQLMDPIGFTFESYDAMGAFRTTDGGEELDLSGNLVATDVDGPFNGVRELATRLASSAQVRNCVASQWYRFSIGRNADTGDSCSLRPLQDAFIGSDANLMDLLVSMTQTEAFLYRRAITEEELAQ